MEKALSLTFWLGFFTTPSILFVLGTNLVLFALNMWVASLIEVNRMTAIGWGLQIPAFLLTLLLSNTFLGETVTPIQYKGAAILMVSMVIGVYGAYVFSG
jgi:drug/metabolite transporter (DMT)-like permease